MVRITIAVNFAVSGFALSIAMIHSGVARRLALPMLPTKLIILLIMIVYLLKVFPPEMRELPGGTAYIRKLVA